MPASSDQSNAPRSPAVRRRHVIVLAGGEPSTLPLPRPLAATDEVIAADGGLASAGALGVRVDRVVGDLDSVAPADLAAARAAGAIVEQHPADKDATDLALALDAAGRGGPAQVTVVGGHGGRLDHLLAGAMLLASSDYAHLEIVALMGPAIVTVIRRQATLTGAPGDLISLLPVHGPAVEVHTSGLQFALTGQRLSPGSSRGVSNVFHQPNATVSLASGVLLAIQPDPTPQPTNPRRQTEAR